MIIQNKILKRGFSANLFKDSSVEYQEGIWEDLSDETKKVIMDNLVYLKLSPYSMFHEEMQYDFSKPYLKDLGDNCVLKDMPRIAEEDNLSTKELIEKFKNKKIRFKNTSSGLIGESEIEDYPLIGMSFGKDSLLSYGIAKELKMEPELVMVQDFWDIEAEHKFDLMGRFEKEFNERLYVVYDYLDDASAYQHINKTNSSGIVGANAMNSYIMMLLPLAIDCGHGNLIFGNEQNFNDYFVNKEGFKVYPSYEQSSEWMNMQNKALNLFTNGQVKVNSFIEPLYNIAGVKVLFNRYPKIAKYQMSCGLSNTSSKTERWCYNCPMCAKAFLYLKACNVDSKIVNFSFDLFGKEHEKLYPLFNNNSLRIYEKPPAVRDEQLFAFYLSYKNGCKGYLIDKFKEMFLSEAKEREDELYNKFFKVHDAVSISGKIKGEINSIYREELKCP
jgi:hypothetical protein